MKRRLLSVLMVMVMAMALLTGCKDSSKENSEKTNGDVTKAAEEGATAAATDITKGATGEGKKVTALFFSLEGEYFTAFDTMLKKDLEALGYKYESQSSNFDPVTMIEQIENAVAGGTDALWVWSISGPAVADACKAAKDAGVIVYNFVTDPGEANRTVFRGSDETECGNTIGEMAIAWADKAYGADAKPGTIKTILMGNPNSAEQNERFDALKAKIASDPRFDVLEAVGLENNIVTAQTTAENMYSKYGQIDAFITTGGEFALGTLAYITSDGSPVKDPTKMGIFGSEINSDFAASMKAGIYKGSVVNGGIVPDNIAVMTKELDTLLKGGTVPSFSPVDMGKVTVDNLADYGF